MSDPNQHHQGQYNPGAPSGSTNVNLQQQQMMYQQNPSYFYPNASFASSGVDVTGNAYTYDATAVGDASGVYSTQYNPLPTSAVSNGTQSQLSSQPNSSMVSPGSQSGSQPQVQGNVHYYSTTQTPAGDSSTTYSTPGYPVGYGTASLPHSTSSTETSAMGGMYGRPSGSQIDLTTSQTPGQNAAHTQTYGSSTQVGYGGSGQTTYGADYLTSAGSAGGAINRSDFSSPTGTAGDATSASGSIAGSSASGVGATLVTTSGIGSGAVAGNVGGNYIAGNNYAYMMPSDYAAGNSLIDSSSVSLDNSGVGTGTRMGMNMGMAMGMGMGVDVNAMNTTDMNTMNTMGMGMSGNEVGGNSTMPMTMSLEPMVPRRTPSYIETNPETYLTFCRNSRVLNSHGTILQGPYLQRNVLDAHDLLFPFINASLAVGSAPEKAMFSSVLSTQEQRNLNVMGHGIPGRGLGNMVTQILLDRTTKVAPVPTFFPSRKLDVDPLTTLVQSSAATHAAVLRDSAIELVLNAALGYVADLVQDAVSVAQRRMDIARYVPTAQCVVPIDSPTAEVRALNKLEFERNKLVQQQREAEIEQLRVRASKLESLIQNTMHSTSETPKGLFGDIMTTAPGALGGSTTSGGLLTPSGTFIPPLGGKVKSGDEDEDFTIAGLSKKSARAATTVAMAAAMAGVASSSALAAKGVLHSAPALGRNRGPKITSSTKEIYRKFATENRLPKPVIQLGKQDVELVLTRSQKTFRKGATGVGTNGLSSNSVGFNRYALHADIVNELKAKRFQQTVNETNLSMNIGLGIGSTSGTSLSSAFGSGMNSTMGGSN